MIPDDARAMVHTIANEVYRKNHGLVPLADLVQEGHLWVVANPIKTQEYLEHEDQREGTRLLAASIRNRLRRFAQEERASALGYRVGECFRHYSAEQIRQELLPAVFDPSLWSSPPQTGEARSKSDPATGGEWIASLADVAEAIGRLDRDTQLLLRLRYLHEEKQTVIASRFDLAESTVSEWIDRAVHQIHEHLGGPKPTREKDEISGVRRSLSNAQARALTSHQWEGE